jgi:hypothetical protein
VEAGLLEFLLNVDLARVFQCEQAAAHPRHLLPAQALLGDVYGGSGQMRTYDVAFGRRGISVDHHQLLLVFHGSHR